MADLKVEVYDTTLRDGAQQEGMNLSIADKLAIADTTLRIAVTMFLALVVFSELLTFASS